MSRPRSEPLPAEIGGVEERRAAAAQLRHEGVVGGPCESRLESIGRGREVGRIGRPGHIDRAVLVNCDVTKAKVTTTAAEIGGVDKRGAAGVQLRHESRASQYLT